MSKIEGYSIQNGKPTPDNPAEIKSLDIEKDIKFIDEMIKEYNTFGDLDNTDYEDTDKIYKAIENILAERKQNKARIKELEKKDKIIDLMAEQIKIPEPTMKIESFDIKPKTKFSMRYLNKEEVKQYFKEIAERKSEEC